MDEIKNACSCDAKIESDLDRGMNARIKMLRKISHTTEPHIDLERAQIETEVYKKYEGSVSLPVLRSMVLKEYFSRKTLYFGDGELILGEKGRDPQCSPTFPELCCHTLEDMRNMDARSLVYFRVREEDYKIQEEEIIPYWEHRSVREKIINHMDLSTGRDTEPSYFLYTSVSICARSRSMWGSVVWLIFLSILMRSFIPRSRSLSIFASQEQAFFTSSMVLILLYWFWQSHY